MAFPQTWNYIQQHLNPGYPINNWTKNKGYHGGQFTIHSITYDAIRINTPGARNIQHVPRDHFESVYNIWSQYRSCTYKRSQIRDNITRFSKYIISIIYWVEINNKGRLP